MRVAIAINRSHRGKPPANAGADFFKSYNARFRNETLEPDEIINAIKAGFAYTTHHRGYRKAANFVMGQHVGLDFDTNDYHSTFEFLARDPFIAGHAAFIHTTASHRPEAPRARVVFLLERPIKQREKYSLLAQALVARYGIADERCKDPCRIFYGAPDCDVLVLGNILTLGAAAEHVVNPYKQKLAAEEARRRREYEMRQTLHNETPPGDVVAIYIKNALDQERDAVARVRPGSRHGAILDAAIRLGGLIKANWVPADLICEDDVYAALLDAARRNGELAQYGERNIRDTIRDGLRYATPREEPLWKQHPESDAGHSSILPEIILTPEQIERERQAIERIRAEGWWQGFHTGMTIGQRIAWTRLGIPDQAIDQFRLGFSPDQEALTIPYFRNGELVNIEYRSLVNESVTYESGLPTLYEAHDHDAPALILDDALTAIKTVALGMQRVPQILAHYSIFGLPRTPLSHQTFDPIGDKPATALLCPQTDETTIKAIRERARAVVLPLSLDEMIANGLDAGGLRWCLRQAA